MRRNYFTFNSGIDTWWINRKKSCNLWRPSSGNAWQIQKYIITQHREYLFVFFVVAIPILYIRCLCHTMHANKCQATIFIYHHFDSFSSAMPHNIIDSARNYECSMDACARLMVCVLHIITASSTAARQCVIFVNSYSRTEIKWFIRCIIVNLNCAHFCGQLCVCVCAWTHVIIRRYVHNVVVMQFSFWFFFYAVSKFMATTWDCMYIKVITIF